jgi:hypothetical protein
MKTLDRGNAIDLDFTASDGSDTEETILQLSRSNSTRPEFRVMTDWLVANDAKIGIGTTTPSDKLEVNGNINVGLNSGAATGYGNRLNMRGVADDGDPIWMSRYNAGPNQTELRVNIGDDAGGEDGFTVGNFFYDDGQWKTFFKVLNNGNVGIGTTAPDAKLTVKGTGAGGAGGLKIINANEVYPQWGLVISQQDNLTGSITSYGRDLQIQPGWDKTLILGSNEMQANGGKVIFPGGNVGIGTTAPDAKLTVKGTIHTNEVKVDLNVPGPDYVFEKGYDLMSLEETKAYIDANKHLPEVPSAKEMEKNGVQLGEMNLLLLKKVEELTLHILRQNEILQRQNDRLEKLERKSKK